MKKSVCVMICCLAVAVGFFKPNCIFTREDRKANFILANLEALALNEGGGQDDECYSRVKTIEESVSNGQIHVNTVTCKTYTCVHGVGGYCYSGTECVYYDGNGKEKHYSGGVAPLAC